MYIIYNKITKIGRLVSDKTQVSTIIGVSVRTTQRRMEDLPWENEEFILFTPQNGHEKSKRTRFGIQPGAKRDKKPWHNSEF